MNRPYMQYGMCCPCMGREKFPAGLKFNSSESEEASRKRSLGMEFHLSTIPCDKPDTGNCSVLCTAKLSAEKIDLCNWILWALAQDLPVKQATF